MTTRSLHRVLGLIMLLPFAGWAVTGAIFFLKPEYGSAYESLSIKTYPLDSQVAITPEPAWLEVRYLKTILGEHLLVRTGDGWRHLDSLSRTEKPAPAESELRALMADAFEANPARYGRIVSVDSPAASDSCRYSFSAAWPATFPSRAKGTGHRPPTIGGIGNRS